jgi:signal peptidase
MERTRQKVHFRPAATTSKMTGHDPDDRGDDADGTEPPEDSPGGWPDDWTTAEDDAHSAPAADSSTPADDDTPAPGDGGALAGDDTGSDESTADEDVGRIPGPDERSPSDDPIANGNAKSTLGKPPDPEEPSAPSVDDEPPTITDDGFLTWFLNTPNGAVVFVRDVLSSIAAVAAIGLLLFAISGIWPPLVAVESGSMEPHMTKGDLVFIVEEERYAPQSAIADTGVSTVDAANAADGYRKFGGYGDVIVYEPFGKERATPIIHRARFHVEEGENWVPEANPEHLGNVDSCAEVPRDMCPAPYDGFITKGDAVSTYDQVGSQSTIVKKEWIRGKAQVRIPLLGWIRLQFAQLTSVAPTGSVPTTALFARLGALGAAAGAAVVATRT